MRNVNNKVTRICVIVAISMGALAACTDQSNDKTGDRSPITTDTSSTAGNATSGYATKDASSSSTTVAKRKARTTISMPAENKDRMVMDKEGVYNKAQVMPQFPGGQDALATYVNNHVDYPQQAIDNNTTGTVMVSFVVDEKGKVKSAHVIGSQAPRDGLDQEALRVVNNMPDWKPGKVRGKNVKTRLELPINFQLEA
ncbi:MAG TPA: energy transducer TonB [Puia sp.]|nr:energy transducer TonB [Puia sp.]